MSEHGLGRIPSQRDPRDDAWPVDRLKAMVKAGIAKPLDWAVPRILDQGGDPTCVSGAILGALNCDDEFHVDPGFQSSDIIPFFQKIAGASMTEGAQLREGLKAAKAAGYISAYSLLRSFEEMIDWLETHGPVLVGTWWYTDMDHPTDGRVRPTGAKRGGHAYYWHGDLEHDLDGVNDWGLRFGIGGHFYITKEDWHPLYSDGGEAWAVVQSVPGPPPFRSGPMSWLVDLLRMIFSRPK